MQDFISVLGIRIKNVSLIEAADQIILAARSKKNTTHIAFVNSDCINIAFKNTQYSNLLNSLESVFGDGSGIRYATKLTGQKIADNVNGTDLYPLLCEYASTSNLSIFYLGASEDVVLSAVEKTHLRYPNLKIAGWHHGFFKENENDDIIQLINESKADILLVAMGAPAQENWIQEHKHDLSVAVAVGVGGLFDFVGSKIERAPTLMRRLGFEWLVRLYHEPLRLLRRYLLGNPLFLWRVVSLGKPEKHYKHKAKQPSDYRSSGSKFDPWRDFKLLDEVESKYIDVDARPSRNTRPIARRHYMATHLYRLSKRCIDISFSLGLLTLLSPLLLFTAVGIMLTSLGPILFVQKRIGLRGHEFRMYRFRSMKINAEAVKQGPCITPLGRFIRHFSIDELPRLYNVLKGDMSLVGPKPALASEVAIYTSYQRQRLEVKPGITGIRQVNEPSDIDFKNQVLLDLEYIEHRSLKQDLSLMLKTIPAIFSGKGDF